MHLLQGSHLDESLGQQHGPQLMGQGGGRKQQLVIFIKRQKVIHQDLSPTTLQKPGNKSEVQVTWPGNKREVEVTWPGNKGQVQVTWPGNKSQV